MQRRHVFIATYVPLTRPSAQRATLRLAYSPRSCLVQIELLLHDCLATHEPGATRLVASVALLYLRIYISSLDLDIYIRIYVDGYGYVDLITFLCDRHFDLARIRTIKSLSIPLSEGLQPSSLLSSTCKPH